MNFKDEWDFYMDKLSEELQLKYINFPCHHYTSPFGLEGILKSKKLWFTEFTMLNDNSEGEMIFECLNDCIYDSLNAFEGSINLNHEFINAIDSFVFNRKNSYSNLTKRLGEIQKYRYFVCCFSKDKDNLEMWNYYTKTPNAVGYNIKFNPNKLIHELRNDLRKLYNLEMITFKVIYDVKRQDNIMNEALDICNEYWNKAITQIEKDVILYHFYNFLEFYKLAFKHSGYRNEQEIRFVIKMPEEQFNKIMENEGDNYIKLNFSNGLFKPYIECSFTDSSIVNSIYVSPTVKDVHAIKSVEYVLMKYKYKKCKIHSSNIPVRY